MGIESGGKGKYDKNTEVYRRYDCRYHSTSLCRGKGKKYIRKGEARCTEKTLNRGWEFMQGDPSSIPGMPKETKTVNLPHDFMVEQDVTADAKGGAEAGFYSGGVGTYIKTLEFLEGELADVMELEFDGCFGLTRVSVNGSPAGRHHYGYTPFRVNIRPFVKVGSNRIVVT